MTRRFVLERVADHEIEPVSLAEAKVHLGEYDTLAASRETEIEAKVAAAREWVEDFTGRALIDQTWRLTIGDQSAIDPVAEPACTCAVTEDSGGEIFLRRSPALAIVSFKSVAADGTETDVDAADYELREADSKWPRLAALNGATWATGVYRIVFRAGYANRDVSPAEGAEVVPERFRQAIMLYMEALYDRADMDLLMRTAEGLIKSERVDLGFA